MMRNRVVVDILRLVEDVFAFTVDPSNTPRWVESVVEERISSEIVGVGTVYRQVLLSGEQNRRREMAFEVVEYEPNRRFSLQRVTPASPSKRATYIFDAYERMTKLTYIEEVGTDGVFPHLKALLTNYWVRKELEAELGTLKAVLEGQAKKDTGRLQAYTNCLVCGSSDGRVLVRQRQLLAERRFLKVFFRKRFYPGTPEHMLKDHVLFTHTYDARLMMCRNCGLLCRDPRLSTESALQEYSNDYYHPDWLKASFQPYHDSFLPEMPRLVRALGSNAKVLEVGSHVGGFLSVAKEYGWQAQGVDVGQIVTAFARAKGFEVFRGTLEEAHLPDNSFDAVFVWLCFEMLPDPWSDLKEINRLLTKDGRLVISVPNGNFIKLVQPFMRWRFLRKYIWTHMAYAILLGFPFQLGYTPKALRYILSKNGFSDVTVRNQPYIPITSPDYVYPWVTREKRRYLMLIHYMTALIYYLSRRKSILGPWIEVTCRKA